jgi:hypothetical protein
MALTVRQDRVFFGIEVPLDDFARLGEAHRRSFPDTLQVEARGRHLIEQDFPEADTRAFVSAVCKWGKHPGISGRVLKHNNISAIRSALREALAHLENGGAGLASALGRVNTLKHLGTPSFASKHLRFLRPDLCPVFDSLLREALPYPFDPEGYAVFARDCSALAAALVQRAVRNPYAREAGQWFVADVEAALYAQVKGLDARDG